MKKTAFALLGGLLGFAGTEVAEAQVIDSFTAGTVTLNACAPVVSNVTNDAGIIGGRREIQLRDAHSCSLGGQSRFRIDATAGIAEFYGATAAYSAVVYGTSIGPYADGSSGNTGNTGTDLGVSKTLTDEIQIDVESTGGNATRVLAIQIRSGTDTFTAVTAPLVAGQTAVVPLSAFSGNSGPLTAPLAANIDGLVISAYDNFGNTIGNGITIREIRFGDPRSYASLITQTALPVGDVACPEGGVRIDTGLDDGAGGAVVDDGLLGPGEIRATSFVCNGAIGADGLLALIRTTDEPPGPNCTNGGVLVESGLDADEDSILGPSEVLASSYVCNGTSGGDGLDALLDTSPELPGPNCPGGGVRIDSGLDADDNGTLGPSEIGSTSYVCNGIGGGPGGAILLLTSDEPAGVHCPIGGVRIDTGIDIDLSGTLTGLEIASTQYVCDGAASLVDVDTLPAGDSNCAGGGVRITTGLDDGQGGGTAGDGTLQSGEVDATAYVCAGASGVSTAGGGGCAVAGSNGAGSSLAWIVATIVGLGLRRRARRG